MRCSPFTARRAILAIAAMFVASLLAASGAQAVVVDDAGTQAGVALVPSTRGDSLPSGVVAVSSADSCTDPWLAPDLGGPAMPSAGLCYGGGVVMHKNETFALTWDQHRAYWSQTRGYVEQFLRDVADASGSLGSPYAVTAQYSDSQGRAKNGSIFGGGCIDYGTVGGSACEYGSTTGAGHDFPANGCTPAGDSLVAVNKVAENGICLTDAQLQAELSRMVAQTGILGRTQPGYTPLMTLLLPPGVETCLDGTHTLCSANSHLTPPPPTVSTSETGGSIPAGTYGVEVTYVTASGESVASSAQSITTTSGTSTITVASPPPASGVTGWYAFVTQPNGDTYTLQGSANGIGSDFTLTQPPVRGSTPPSATAFCSYHSQVNVAGTAVAYVVQPWTAGTGCDEPGVPNIPDNPTPAQLSVGVGQRLVSPLSQAAIAAIVNPALNGWAALNGSEIDDNGGCVPLPKGLDSVTVGSSSQNPYFLQREFNNAYVLEFDPFTYYGCAPVVSFSPAFVAPSLVNQGDEVQFDGSATASTLIVPNQGYSWSFGDGTAATGPSVVHVYAKAGTYKVTLTATDRGGNTQTTSQQLTVVGPTVPPPPPTPPPGQRKLSVHLQVMPESLRALLSRGLAMRVTSNGRADGIVTVSIPRSAARRVGMAGRGRQPVVIGRGTVSRQIRAGTVTLHLRLSTGTAAKLRRLTHVTLAVRLVLVGTGGQRLRIVAAARY